MKNKHKKYIFVIFIISTIYMFLQIYCLIDKNMVEKRLYYISMQVFLFKNQNKYLPNDINSIFDGVKTIENESWCDFYDKKIPGWGYCYYSVIDSDFFVDIRGSFTAITYRSDLNIIDNSYNYDL